MDATVPARVRRDGRIRPRGWWFDGVLVLGFTGLTVALAGGLGAASRSGLLAADRAVRDWSDGHRPPVLDTVTTVANLLGRGGPLTTLSTVIAVVLAWRTRSARPLAPVALAFGLTFTVLTALKNLTDRAAPHAYRPPDSVPHPELLGSGGVSYPSGHLVNAIVWYGVLVLLLARWLPVPARRLVRVVPAAVLTGSTVYLGFHWATDTLAGLVLGLLLERVLRRVFPVEPLPGRPATAAPG